MGQNHIQKLKNEIKSAHDQLASHQLYFQLRTGEELRCFMEHHIFAVWDFMSLLKALQRGLTCVEVPWVPNGSPVTRRLINEIVIGEESDEDSDGNVVSHFEMYRDAMVQCGANLGPADEFMRQLNLGADVRTALRKANAPLAARQFVETTFSFIETGSLHRIAAAFTFGREELIPDMFIAIVGDLERRFPGRYTTFKYYLDRHIELDGDEHGDLACRMIEELCGDDEKKWQEVAETAIQALEARMRLWDGVLLQTSRKAS